MNADERGSERGKMDQLTQTVIRCAFTVSNTLGCGFLEEVYENALAHELRKAGLQVQQQHEITVYYDGVVSAFIRVHLRFYISGTTSG